MKLGKQDAAIIFRAAGAVELALPKAHMDEPVNDNTLMATAIMLAMREKSFDRLIQKQYKKLLELIENEEQKENEGK